MLNKDLQFNVIHPSNLLLKSNSVPHFSHTLQNPKAPYGCKQVKSFPTGKGLMDPGTFKLVIEHQKEYSLPLPDFTQNKVRLGQKKLWDTFWPKLKAESRKRNDH